MVAPVREGASQQEAVRGANRIQPGHHRLPSLVEPLAMAGNYIKQIPGPVVRYRWVQTSRVASLYFELPVQVSEVNVHVRRCKSAVKWPLFANWVPVRMNRGC